MQISREPFQPPPYYTVYFCQCNHIEEVRFVPREIELVEGVESGTFDIQFSFTCTYLQVEKLI